MKTGYPFGCYLLAMLSLILLVCPDRGRAENWTPFTDQQLDGSRFVYDRESISWVSSNTLLVWEKKMFPPLKRGKRFEKSGGVIKMRLWEIN